MIRRVPLALCALAATLALTSCTTTSDNNAAARVGTTELDAAQLSELAGAVTDGLQDGELLRNTLTNWIRTMLLEDALIEGGAQGGIDNLQERLNAAANALVGQNLEAGRAVYEGGVRTSPLLCLLVIQVDDTETADEVLSELDGGMSFAEAAAEFSTDPTLAASGGVALDAEGNDCSDAYSDDVKSVLDGKAPGEATVITLGGITAVIALNPWDNITEASQLLIARAAPETADALDEILSGADIHVDSRYGRWDPESNTVVALGA